MKAYTKVLAGLSMSVILSACLKDKNIENKKYGFDGVEDISLVEFSNAEFVAGINAANKDTTIHLATVHLNAAAPASQDIKVTLRVDEEAVTDAGYAILPSDRYSLSGLTVTIPKGSRDGYLDITVNPNDLLDDHYAFAFEITGVDGGHMVSANFRTLLSELIVLNQYDGIYEARGVVANHPTLSGPFSREIPLETTSLTSVWFYQPNRSGLFGVSIDIDVNPDNTLTLTGSPAPYIPAGAQNYYDPATRTFYLNFKWPGTPDRQAKDTLVYVGPRF